MGGNANDNGDDDVVPDEESHDSRFESVFRKAARVEDDPVLSMLPWRGQIVGGKYRIEGIIGRGAMGAVYRASHVVTQKAVALKWMLHPTNDEQAQRRFVREALAAGRIDHPNVVDVYDVGQEGQNTYLVMELLHGETLRARLQAGALSVAETITLLVPALHGVAAMHRAGVIHRDLKPENIFLCKGSDGSAREAKVLDFGVSIVTTATGLTLSHAPGAQSVIGTPAYMSPEQLESPSNVDARTDVYAFGAILYDALTGQMPFHAGSYPALILSILRERPKHPCELRPELPRALGDVVLRALAKRRNDRYPNMESLLAEVQRFDGSSELPAPQRKWPLRASVAVLGGLSLLAAAYLFTTRRATESAVMSASTLYSDTPGFLSGAACWQCLADSCHEQDTACSEDAGCSDIRARMSQVKEPLVASRDVWRRIWDARWASDHGQGNSAPLRDALRHCARARCEDACDTGRKLACVGKFEYAGSYPKQTHLRLRFQDGETTRGIQGLHIRACSPGTHCEHPLGEGVSESNGLANVLVDFALVPHHRTALTAEFTGYLMLDETPEYLPAVLWFSQPAFDQTYGRFHQPSRASLLGSLQARGLPIPDDTHGLLEVQAEDCEGWSIRGATVELWNAGATGYTRCDTCPVWYPDDNGDPDPALTQLSSKTGEPARAVLPARDVLVVVRDAKSQLPIAVRALEILPGYQHTIKLYPASLSELARLPK